ncbi:MAG: chemotaxis protein CheW [Pseudomonadota bacterium]
MDLDDEVVALYVEEALEHLDGIEDVLLEIESGGANADPDLVNKVFRGIHSVKGGAGFFGLDNIKDLGHDMENVLNMIRNKELVPTPEIVSVLLASADLLQQMFDDLAGSNERDISESIQALRAISEGGAADAPAAEAEQPAPEAVAEEPVEEAPTPAAEEDPEPDTASAEADTQTAEATEPEPKAPPEAKPKPAPAAPAPAPAPARAEPAASAPTGEVAEPGGDAKRGTTPESKLRVSVKLLDQLMTLAGELVLTRNQMSLAINSSDTMHVQQASQRLDQITSELQEAIVSTRMQPVGVVFSKFRRVVRDMAKQLDKKINLEIEGEEVELDKTIIEGLSDPLTHLVRNGVDHGIEMPDVRAASGKSEEATLNLRAFHEAGQVIIEVADDGRGVDPDKVKEKAAEKGLKDRAVLDAMSDAELVKLIFLPGFSTAGEITDISGRGVGMDVVNTNLTQMGGVVDVKSAVGQGTTIRIKLPLTLAIIPSLIVGLSERRYAVPQVNVQELVRIPAAEVGERIQSIGGSQIMRLRGELLPIVQLSEILSMEPVYRDRESGELRRDRRQVLHDRRAGRDTDPDVSDERRQGEGNRRTSFESAVSVVVVLAGSLRYGIVVDQLLDSEEIVVKPLDNHFKGQQIYAGATIQGDGGVAMILDVVELSRFVALDASRAHELEAARRQLGDGEGGKDKMSLLLVKSGERETFAIPLPLITRIEKIDRGRIEVSGRRRSMIYREGSLVLFTLDDVASVQPIADGDEAYVVVFSVNKREVGLLVSSLEDTVNVAVEFDRETFRQPGIFGSAIIRDRTTFLVDLLGVVEAAEPEWARRTPEALEHEDGQRTILVVEDSSFFREHLKSFLEEAGFAVITAEDGRDGLQQLDAKLDEIDLVMTDIEMPNMDGFAFTEAIRASNKFRHLAVIAVTSLAGDVDKARGFRAGVNEYLIKLDKEEILTCLDRYLAASAEEALA